MSLAYLRNGTKTNVAVSFKCKLYAITFLKYKLVYCMEILWKGAKMEIRRDRKPLCGLPKHWWNRKKWQERDGIWTGKWQKLSKHLMFEDEKKKGIQSATGFELEQLPERWCHLLKWVRLREGWFGRNTQWEETAIKSAAGEIFRFEILINIFSSLIHHCSKLQCPLLLILHKNFRYWALHIFRRQRSGWP